MSIVPNFMGSLGAVLKEFWSSYPSCHVDICSAQSRTVLNQVATRNAHLGIARLPVISNELEYRILFTDEFVVYVDENSELSHRECIYPVDLKNFPIAVVNSSLEQNGFYQILQMFDEAGVHPFIVSHVDSTPMLLQVVGASGVVGIGPHSGRNFARRGIKAIPLGGNKIYAPLAVIWLKSEVNATVLRFRDMIVTICSAMEYED